MVAGNLSIIKESNLLEIFESLITYQVFDSDIVFLKGSFCKISVGYWRQYYFTDGIGFVVFCVALREG